MDRRDFLKKSATGTVALGTGLGVASVAEAKTEFKWKMVTRPGNRRQ